MHEVNRLIYFDDSEYGSSVWMLGALLNDMSCLLSESVYLIDWEGLILLCGDV